MTSPDLAAYKGSSSSTLDPSLPSELVGGRRVLDALVPDPAIASWVDPIEVHDLYATILQTLGVQHNKELTTPIGRPMALCKGKPIDRLLV
jgi:hypothetical protein